MTEGDFSTDEIFLISYLFSIDDYPNILIVKPDSEADKKQKMIHAKILSEYDKNLDRNTGIKEFFILLEATCKYIWTTDCVGICESFLLKNNKKSIAKKIRADQGFRLELLKLWDTWEFKEEGLSSAEISFGQNRFTIPAPVFSAKYIVENYNEQTQEGAVKTQNPEVLASNLIDKLRLKVEKREAKKDLVKKLLHGFDQRIKVAVNGKNSGKALTSLFQIPIDKLVSIKFLMEEISLKFKGSTDQDLYDFLSWEYGNRSENNVSFSRIRFEEVKIKGTPISNVAIFDINSFNRLLVYQENNKLVFNICISGFYHDERN